MSVDIYFDENDYSHTHFRIPPYKKMLWSNWIRFLIIDHNGVERNRTFMVTIHREVMDGIGTIDGIDNVEF